MTTPSKSIMELLVKHLLEIEEGKDELLDRYFPELSQERYEFKNLINDYIKQIEQLIRNSDKSKTMNNKVPFATIGSEIELQDLSNQEIFKYRIVSPFHSSVRAGDVSFLSPVGKSLLLKKPGEIVVVKAPAGTFRYKIISIELQVDT